MQDMNLQELLLLMQIGQAKKFMKYQWLQMRKPLRLLVCGR